uniref:Uncharacterized protein n=1 Tax=Phlebotomus papatasi TaxID=29031 RepID=A0A1B0DHU4_PHLPP
MEDDLSKASTHSGSIRDESVVSTDHQTSFSSDPPSNTNLAYISDADRRTSAEMPDIPCDSATVDRLSDLYATGGGGSSSSSGRQTGRFSVTNVGDGAEKTKIEQRPTLLDFSNAGSQDSEDWPLPEIPYDHVPVAKIPLATDSRPVPKSFGWRHSMSMQSQDSENWPSPPDSGDLETPIVENIETFYLSEQQSATQVMVDSFTDHTPDDDDSENRTLNEDNQSNKDIHKSPTVSFFPMRKLPTCPHSLNILLILTCLSSTFGSASCLRSTIDVCSSRNTFTSSKDVHPSDKVIISQPTRTPQNQSPNSLDDDFGLADDVFGPGTVKIEISPDDTRLSDILTDKLSRGSNNSDTSLDDILSGSTFMDETVRRNLEPRLSSGSCKKCSHSSHSEEETSSLGTDLDGTVKMGLQQKKCTHSSHSEDTSIGLSISEWSTGTNTVRQYANLSGSDSLSAVSNHSTGARSEKSNHTKSSVSSINKSTESLNEKSASLSGSKSKFSCENPSVEGGKYEVFSNSEISSGTTKSDDTTLTLTEMAQSITEWSTSSSKTLVAQLDTSLVKFSRSFDDTTKTTEKLDKANRSFEDRNKSVEEASDKSDIGEDFVLKSPRKIMRSQELKRQIEGSVVHKKFEGKSKSLEKRPEQIHQYLDIETKTRSLDKNFELNTFIDAETSKKKTVQVEVHRGAKAESSDSDRYRKSTDSSESKSTSTSKSWTSLDDSRISGGKQEKSEVDMQAIISERRNLDLLKRQSLPSEDAKDTEEKSPGPLSHGNSEESLTSVSDLKPGNEAKVSIPHRVPTIECEEPSIEEDVDEEKTLKPDKEDSLLKLGLERSRSDETASWKTFECEEYVGSVGTDASDISKASTLKGDPSLQMQNTLEDAKDSNFLEPEDFDMNIIVTPPDSSPLVEKMPLPGTPSDDRKSDLSKRRGDMLRITVERSRSSDTASSWTSGEKDTSPVRGEGRDKGSMDEESSVSCSISRPLGISQDNFELYDQQRCKELRDTMLKKEADQQQETIRTPTRERKASTPTLEKQSPIDLESGSELDQDPIEMKIDQILARNDSGESSSGQSMGNKKIKIISTSADNVHKKLCRMSGDGSRSPDRSTGTDTKKLVATRLSSSNGKSSLESKSSLDSKGSISVESKGSFETESSSGSLGMAQRRGELGQREQQSTWKPFPIESSGSSSIEENWAPPDQESYEKYDISIQRGVDDLSTFKPVLEKKESSPDEMKESDSSAQDDLSDFTTNFGYPAKMN